MLGCFAPEEADTSPGIAVFRKDYKRIEHSMLFKGGLGNGNRKTASREKGVDR
jgi:hypothetical protein